MGVKNQQPLSPDKQEKIGVINSIECIDVSHTFGKQIIASCVVFNRAGSDRSMYRKYNISKNNKGDDIASIGETIHRRYKKLLDNSKMNEFPDILLIDGGKAQVNKAMQVLIELGVESKYIDNHVYGMTKGEGRRAINDKIISGNDFSELKLDSKSSVKHLLQQIRDEAHKFAIMGHRSQRSKQQLHSLLEDIPGIGAKRRKALLTHFGGWQELKKATQEQISSVPGISEEMSVKIYNYLN